MGASQLILVQSKSLFPAKECTGAAIAIFGDGSNGARFGS